MSFTVKADPEDPSRTIKVPLTAAEIEQRARDEAAHAARMAAPKPPTLAERLATLETELSALKRGAK